MMPAHLPSVLAKIRAVASDLLKMGNRAAGGVSADFRNKQRFERLVDLDL